MAETSADTHVCSVLFVDISGYTAMCTSLGRHGAGKISSSVNGYLSKLIEIIEEHGGCIAVRSASGEGTTFFLRLPTKEFHE